MEERMEYMKSTGRRGKVFVGGYIDTAMAERLHKVRDLNGWTMVELIEHMAESAAGVFELERCAYSHE